jgi:hypothetical protein
MRWVILAPPNSSRFPAFGSGNLNKPGPIEYRYGGRGSLLCTVSLLSIQLRAMTLRAGVAKLAGVALAGSLLIVAAPAAAKTCHPHHGGGNSEIGQYLENIPGPCGDQSIGGNGSGDQGGSGSNAAGLPSGTSVGLPSGTISQLQSKGSAGAQTVGFAEATNPGGSGGAASRGNAGSSAGSGSAGTGTASDDGGSLLSALEHLVAGNDASTSDGGQGLGIWMPILLIAVLLGGFATLAVRRGRTG